MASLALTSPPAVKIPSYLSSSSSSLFSRSSISFTTTESPSRISVFSGSPKCNLPKALNLGNGNARIPMINETTIPKFFDSSRLEKSESVSRTNTKLKLFSGTANPALSQEIAWYMGLELGKISIKRFADGEVYVQLKESVRGCDVFLVQPTCTPTNENLMELLIMVDACRRASAKKVTAVIPYFGYARADRKTQGRESIAAKLVANLITEAGADRVLACDLHSGQSMGYFDIPVDHVYCQPVILDYLASKSISSEDLVVVSPDVGGVARARAFAKKLSDAPLAIVDKRRHGHNVAEVMNLIGDVKGKVAVMVDDMIDTAVLHEFYKAPPDEFIDKVAALRSRGEQNWPDISQRRIERCIRKFQSAKYDGSPYRPVLHSSSEDDMAPINLNDGPSIVGEKKKAGAKADAGGSSRRGGKETDASQKKEKKVPVVGKDKAATVPVKAPPKKLTKQQKAKGVVAAGSQKRLAEEAEKSVSPPPAKKAKATQALTFEYAGEKDVIWKDRSACAELFRAASGSSAPQPEDTGEEDRYLFVAQMLLKAGCALTLLYDGMSGKVAEAASGGGEEVGELQAAVEKAKEAYAVEQARSASLETELGQTKVELEKYVVGVSKEQAENGRLRAKLAIMEKRLADESNRLRRSRADCVSRERGLRQGLVEKVRTYLRGKKEADDVKSLYHQAKGTREALEDVKLKSETLILDDAIAQYGRMEEQYKAEAGLSSFDELVEGDLVAYEDRPGINEYGSNDGLTTEEGTLKIPEVSSQTPPAGEEQPVTQDG